MRSKKASQETLSFLIGILIAIMIIAPIAIVTYRVLESQGATEKCYNDIIEAAKELKDGQQEEILCKFNSETSILGFDSNEMWLKTQMPELSQISLYASGVPVDLQKAPRIAVSKPNVCPMGELACLCLCQLEPVKTDSGIILPSYQSMECRRDIKCEQFRGIKSIYGSSVSSLDIDYKEEDFYVIAFAGVQGFSLKRVGDKISICISGKSCDLPAIAENIDMNKFESQVSACNSVNNDNCYCESILNKSLPLNNYYKLFNWASTHNLILSGEQGDHLLKEDLSEILCYYNGSQKVFLKDKDEVINFDRIKLLRIDGHVCITNTSKKFPLCTQAAPEEPQAKESKVPLRSAPSFTFAAIADPHYQLSDSDIVKKGIEKIKSLKPDFVIINGDMVDAGYGDSASKVDSLWSNFNKDIRDALISSNINIVPAAGNHDIIPSSSVYKSQWQSFPLSFDNVKGNYPQYYSFDYNNNHFVILYAPGYTINEAQMGWLESDLMSAKGKYQNIFVFGHMPLSQICTGISHCSTTLKPKDDLIKLFNETNVEFYGSAHHHNYFKGSMGGVKMLSIGPLQFSYAMAGTKADGTKHRQKASFAMVEVGPKVDVKSYTGSDFNTIFDESNFHNIRGYSSW